MFVHVSVRETIFWIKKKTLIGVFGLGQYSNKHHYKLRKVDTNLIMYLVAGSWVTSFSLGLSGLYNLTYSSIGCNS